MICLGGAAQSEEIGRQLAESTLADSSALAIFFKMIEEQGGDTSVFDDPHFHKPGATEVLNAWESGFIAEMDTTKIGWAVQRLGAGREKAGEPVDPHAGILFHARRGAHVEQGQPVATLYATSSAMQGESVALLKDAITISETQPEPVPLVSRIFTLETAEAYLGLPSNS
jgi:pyrimidine-nucleoside phosphorylase